MIKYVLLWLNLEIQVLRIFLFKGRGNLEPLLFLVAVGQVDPAVP